MADSYLRILLVEDDPADSKHIRHLLAQMKDMRIYFDIAENFTEGFERLKADRVHVLLLDMSLPDSQGIQAIEKVHNEAPNTAILALHTTEDEDLSLDVIRQGAQDYLVKGGLDSVKLEKAIRYASERKNVERKLARLASFAWQNQNPIFEMDMHGVITYLNPAGRRLFPELMSRDTGHPFMDGLISEVETLRQENKDFLIRDIKIGERYYEQHISFVFESDSIRSYISDHTERKQAEDKLRLRTEEVERMNRVMIGREMKIIELKERIAQLEGKQSASEGNSIEG